MITHRICAFEEDLNSEIYNEKQLVGQTAHIYTSESNGISHARVCLRFVFYINMHHPAGL